MTALLGLVLVVGTAPSATAQSGQPTAAATTEWLNSSAAALLTGCSFTEQSHGHTVVSTSCPLSRMVFGMEKVVITAGTETRMHRSGEVLRVRNDIFLAKLASMSDIRRVGELQIVISGRGQGLADGSMPLTYVLKLEGTDSESAGRFAKALRHLAVLGGARLAADSLF